MKFIQLEEELEQYKKIMAAASDSILDGEVSKYPIFVVHQQVFEVGVLLSSADSDDDSSWSLHASTLEEFAAKQIISMEKAEDFIKVFKDPKDHFCVFVLSELGANFVFIPR